MKEDIYIEGSARVREELRERRKIRLLNALIETGGRVREACRITGFSHNFVWQERAKDPEFDRAFSAAMEMSTEVLEDEAIRRAVEGVEIPQFHKGQIVGYVRQYSDRMMELLLMARRPDKYRPQRFSPKSIPPDALEPPPHIVDAITNAETAAMTYAPIEAVPTVEQYSGPANDELYRL